MSLEQQALTETELDYLYQFCRKHYIRYYDVQVELVDHLANAVEALMRNRPQITFTEAVDVVYTGFGKTGFRNIIKAKEEALEKQHQSFYNSTFRSYFTLPRILKTAVVAALVFIVDRFTTGNTTLRLAMLTVIAGGTLVWEIALPILLYYRHQRPKQELLTRQVRPPFYYGYYLFYYPSLNYLFNYFWGREQAINQAQHYFSVISLLCLLSLLLQLVHKEVSERIYRKAYQDYPLAYD